MSKYYDQKVSPDCCNFFYCQSL